MQARRTTVELVAEIIPAEGELLTGFDDDWVVGLRQQRHEDAARRAAADVAEAEAQGRLDDAVAAARRLDRLQPLDEPAHRELLRLLIAAGDRAGAVQAAREFDTRLRTELGVRPAPVTRAAHAELRAVPAPRVVDAFFGRTSELAELDRAWREAAAGRGRAILLHGEAGIGKSALLATFANRLHHRGAAVAIARGVDVGGETPFAAWLDLCRSLAAAVPRPNPEASWPAELGRLSPQLSARLGAVRPPAQVAAPELERLRVFESVLRLVEWTAADRPLLIGLDDAHWVDRASLRLTAHIGRRLASLPVLVVLCRRDESARAELDELVDDLAAWVPLADVTVGPVGDRDLRAIAAAAAALTDGQLAEVVGGADGNPLFAVETAKVVSSGGTGPPPTLRAAVRSTFTRLSPSAQALARLLAVAGRPLTPAELDRCPIEDRAGAESAAIGSGLLVRERGGLAFRHDLLRDVVYAESRDNAGLHHVVARAIDAADSADVARHLALAGRPDEAGTSWLEAADRAQAVGALTEAAEFAEQSVQCRPSDGRAWLRLQEIEAWRGRRDAMELAWSRALTLLPTADLAEAWCLRGRQFRTVVCYPEESFAAYRTARELLGDNASELAARVLTGLAWGQAVAGDPAAVPELLGQVAELVHRPDPQLAGDVAEIRIQGLIRQGRFTECAEIAESAGRTATAHRLPERVFAIYSNAACAMACAGDFGRALEFTELWRAATVDYPVLLVPSLTARALLLARLGRHDEADAAAAELLARAERLDSATRLATGRHDAGMVALATGRYAESADLLAQALDASAGFSRPGAMLARAEALARAGRADAARDQLRAAVSEPVGRADQPWALVHRVSWVQALIALASGDRATAVRRLDEAEGGWRRIQASVPPTIGEDYVASLVDLGRPPVAGLVEPTRELEAIDRLRRIVDAPDGTIESRG